MKSETNPNPKHISLPPEQFGVLVQEWFAVNRRDLPWRNNRTPYRVWIAEIMLQQTTVQTVTKRFDRWMAKFPTIEVLSDATESEVMAEWEGLGYYSRARNIHATARVVVADLDGQFPSERSALLKLPGIGDYTAAAILSIAFDKPIPMLDVNVRRIATRYLGVNLTEKQIVEYLTAAATVCSPVVAGEGLMELAQLVCTASNPNCSLCPLSITCESVKLGTLTTPVITTKKRIVRRAEMALVAINDGAILVKPPAATGLFAGLTLLPTVAVESEVELELATERFLYGIPYRVVRHLSPVMHHYTTNAVRLFPVQLEIYDPLGIPVGLKWLPLQDLVSLALPSAHRKILAQIEFQAG